MLHLHSTLKQRRTSVCIHALKHSRTIETDNCYGETLTLKCCFSFELRKFSKEHAKIKRETKRRQKKTYSIEFSYSSLKDNTSVKSLSDDQSSKSDKEIEIISLLQLILISFHRHRTIFNLILVCVIQIKLFYSFPHNRHHF